MIKRLVQNYKLPAKRLIALTVCVCLILVIVISAAVIVSHDGHEHNIRGARGKCTACADVAVAQSLLLNICLALGFTVFALGCCCIAVPIANSFKCNPGYYTLVRLRVRINN